MENYFDFEEVMRQLNLGEEELKRMVSDGVLRTFRESNKMMFLKTDVETTKKGHADDPIILPDNEEDGKKEAGMTLERILEVIAIYETRLEALGVNIVKSRHAATLHFFDRGICLGHLRTMFPKLKRFVREGRTEKAFQWLGFIQGVLWSTGLYTIEELRTHSRTNT